MIQYFRNYFNSIKVQLELKIIIKVALYALFQFIKVQLELVYVARRFFATKFQFHKGTIRTP